MILSKRDSHTFSPTLTIAHYATSAQVEVQVSRSPGVKDSSPRVLGVQASRRVIPKLTAMADLAAIEKMLREDFVTKMQEVITTTKGDPEPKYINFNQFFLKSYPTEVSTHHIPFFRVLIIRGKSPHPELSPNP